jgi:hypothetical protein
MPTTQPITQTPADNLNASKKALVVQYFRELRGNITESCAGAEISRTTFYEWLREDQAFASGIDDVRAELNDEMEQALIERARVDRSDTAIIFYLKYRHPDYKQLPQTLIQNNTIITDKRKEYELG